MKYKEKLEEAKKLYASANANQKRVLESLFPELRESEDERIRKEIINYFECQSKEEPSRKDTHNKWIVWLEKQNGANVFDAPKTSIKDTVEVSSRMQYIEDDMKPIADFIIDYALWDLRKDEWNQPTITVPLFRVLDALIQKGKPYCECNQNLEKQGDDKPIKVMKSPEESLGISSKEYNDIVNECLFGKSKSAEKVEPKFHEGEWIVFNGLTLYIKEVVKGFYRTISKDGIPNSYDWDIDNVARLWGLEDARDGDVLAESTCIFLIKKLDSDLGAKIYYCLHDDGDFEINSKLCFDYTSTYPATEEQREALTKAMKEAGYVFDFDKKELRKITSPADVGFVKLGKAWAKENKKKSAGSEDDKDMIQALDACIDAAIKSGMNYISFDSKSILIGNIKNWLKSLKQRIS